MKNKKLLLLTFTFLSGILIFCAPNTLASPITKSEREQIIRDVAMAYYRKGPNAQYSSSRHDLFLSPEQITSQSASDYVCSSFTHAIYYEAFGMHIPDNTARLNSYAKTYYGQPTNNDIVYFKAGQEFKDKVSTPENREAFKNELLGILQIGDIISFYSSGQNKGHDIIIYNLQKNQNDDIIDAIIINSRSNNKTSASKHIIPLSWNATFNSVTNTTEGTIKIEDLTTHINLTKTIDADYFTVYRPFAISDTTYNNVICKNDNNATLGQNCNFETVSYQISNNSSNRLKYPGIEIEKTVDVFNNSVVKPGTTLTYNIAITNHSSSSYKNLQILENIPTEYVSHSSNQANLSDTITIPAGQTYNYKYSVKVKADASLLGSKIISTGTVGGIPSSTVTNYIGNNLTAQEQQKIKSAYDSLKNQYSNKELINQIYKSALGIDLHLENLLLGAHYNQPTNSQTIQNRNRNCNPYFQENDANALINTFYSNEPDKIQLNKNNSFAKILLTSYYSASYIYYNDACGVLSSGQKFFTQPYARTPETSNPTDRQKRIYPENLQTGDILIYEDKGPDGNADPVTNEQGTYVFIWIAENGTGNFYGVNQLADGTAQNIISGVNDGQPNTLWSIYGKDYYAIFRPALALEHEQEILPPNTGTSTKEPSIVKLSKNILIIIGAIFTVLTAINGIIFKNTKKVNFKTPHNTTN